MISDNCSLGGHERVGGGDGGVNVPVHARCIPKPCLHFCRREGVWAASNLAAVRPLISGSVSHDISSIVAFSVREQTNVATAGRYFRLSTLHHLSSYAIG